MIATIRFRTLGWTVLIALGLLPAASLAQEYSHARIVRLSYTEGAVTLQRPDLPEWAKAAVNTPIEEGFKVATADGGFAEIEFENTSTARLGQDSLLEFTQLALAPDGSKINHLKLGQGYATFTVFPGNGDDNQIETPYAVITADGKTMFRIDLDQGTERVEVFKGSVEVASAYGSGKLGRDRVLDLTPGAQDAYVVTKGITKDAWDGWVQGRQNEVAAGRARNGFPASYGSLYGWNDLSYYGSWTSLPGYGYGWIPMGLPYGWMPYSYGAWSWYPTFGYTWISYDPWGWLPFHYGSWVFLPTYGWAWLPGSFDAWSPALVTWYDGPGWVGWVPAGTTFYTSRRFTNGRCSAGQNCVVALSAENFQRGTPVTSKNMILTNANDGIIVTRPAIEPTLRARLPGAVASPPSFLTRTATANNVSVSGAGTKATGAASETVILRNHSANPPAPRVNQTFSKQEGPSRNSNIVFDPTSHEYVNSGTAPATPSKPAGSAPAARPMLSGSKTPAASAPFNEPAPPSNQGQASGSRSIFWGNHHAAPQSGAKNPGWNFGARGRNQRSAPRSGGSVFRSRPAQGSFGIRTGGGGMNRSFHPASAPPPPPPPSRPSAPVRH